jgi:acyl carrier protein
MKTETLHEVIQLVAEYSGVAESSITASTRLGEDLGVDGDDASDLIAAFASRFHVDIAVFDFSRHFGPEAGFSPFSIHPSPRLEPVTVGHLAETVERGAWSYAA